MSAPTPMPIATPEWLRLLQGLFYAGDGLIEFRAISREGRVATAFVRPGNWNAVHRFSEDHKDKNCYFGVAARKDSTSGALKNCTRLRALFADLDFSD